MENFQIIQKELRSLGTQTAVHRGETFAIKEQVIRIIKSQGEVEMRETEVREGLKTMYDRLLDLKRDISTLLHELLPSSTSIPISAMTDPATSSTSSSSSSSPSAPDVPSVTLSTPSTNTMNASRALMSMSAPQPPTPPPHKIESELSDLSTNGSKYAHLPPTNLTKPVKGAEKYALTAFSSESQSPSPFPF